MRGTSLIEAVMVLAITGAALVTANTFNGYAFLARIVREIRIDWRTIEELNPENCTSVLQHDLTLASCRIESGEPAELYFLVEES